MTTLVAATGRRLLSGIRGHKPPRIPRNFPSSPYASTLSFLVQMQTMAAEQHREKRSTKRGSKRGKASGKKRVITYHPRLEDDVRYFIKVSTLQLGKLPYGLAEERIHLPSGARLQVSIRSST